MKTKKNNDKTDEEIVSEIQQGNLSLTGILYARYQMLVFHKCLSFTKNADDASDLTQDIMIKVIEKIDGFKNESKFSTWLYAVTFNYCTDYIRKSKKNLFESVDTCKQLSDNSTVEFENAMLLERRVNIVSDAISLLDVEDRQMLVMKYQLNKSIAELQAIYNLSASAVKMRLMRAKAKIHVIYSSYQSAVA